MTSWDAFNTKGFDAFVTPGFDARNTTCVPTTLLSTGQYVWGVGLPSSPTYSLDGNVGFDSRGRMWVAPLNTLDRQPDVYDAQANLLLTGPVQSGRLLYPTGAGQGACVMAVFDETVHIRANKLVCFDAEDASVKWIYDRSGAAFQSIHYANGVVFAGFQDHDNLLPGAEFDFQTFEYSLNNNLIPARRTIALNSETGAVLGTAVGLIQAVCPDGGLVVLTRYDNWLPNEPLPAPFPVTFTPADYVRHEADYATVVWTKSSHVGNQVIQASDVDETGTAWLLTAEELISIDPVGVETTAAVSDTNAWSWGVSEMAVDLCAPSPRAFLRGGFFLAPNITPRQSTLQTLSLTNPSINPEGGNFPSTIGGSNSQTLRINGKWSIFT